MMRCAIGATAIASVCASGDFPVIAILAQPSGLSADGCGGSCQYIAASYVKFLELGGARTLPVNYYSTDAEIDEIMTQVNGFLFPGGSSDLPPAGQRIVDNALDISRKGGYFPVWGTCLGYEWVMQAIGGLDVLASGFDAHNLTLPLDFTEEAASSSLYADAEVRTIWETKPVALNSHGMGVTPAEFASNAALKSTLRLLSTNKDRQGREFVSSVQGINAPIYATQYHAEKNIFEWGTRDGGIPYLVTKHSPDAIRVAQNHATFFVSETRRNKNVYDLASSRPFFESLPTSTAKSPSFVQVYFLWEDSERKRGASSLIWNEDGDDVPSRGVLV